MISPSGVYVCPYWRGKERYCIGNARENSISQIWHGSRRAEVMKYTDPGRVCDFHCLRHQSNLDVLDMIQTDRQNISLIDEYDRFF